MKSRSQKLGPKPNMYYTESNQTHLLFEKWDPDPQQKRNVVPEPVREQWLYIIMDDVSPLPSAMQTWSQNMLSPGADI